MIEKPSILITSVGRTGTEFFAKLFSEILPDCTSLHEPDIFKYTGIQNRLGHFSEQIRQAGLWRMVILKALGKWTLVNISDARFRGVLDYHQAATRLHDQRLGFVARMPGTIYVESNLGYYGLLDVLPETFKNHRAIYIVRDARDWIRSTYNWGEVYGKKGLRKLLAHKWPTAGDIPGDALARKWESLSKFERLCWTWARLNEFALNNISKNPHARLFHFEKIFTGEKRYSYLNDLLQFATSLTGMEHPLLNSTDGWLERKIHESSNRFPGWETWTVDQKRHFEIICGPLMAKLGYPFS
jgi:hypothetical protein